MLLHAFLGVLKQEQNSEMPRRQTINEPHEYQFLILIY
jgi:hypothetical protein